MSRFENVEEEANQYAQSLYYEDPETAYAESCEFYFMLRDMENKIRLATLMSLYHQWEKDLKEFIENEVKHFGNEQAQKAVWDSSSANLLKSLISYGWDLESKEYYNKIDAARLIVNCHKHGKGGSFEKLYKEYPQYLKKRGFGPNHEDLFLSEKDFLEIADAFLCFWNDFPERLYIN